MRNNISSLLRKLAFAIALPAILVTIFAQHSRAAGYAAAVQADGPIAYWRFNDNPPTAVNSGSLGAAANGTYNGGAAPGAQAPRTPAFVGFEANNTALQCDGVAGFMGTAISLMNGRPVFTISGWMRRNADQANRTGLWGQNDIVEFGYINNNTIELWTDNGLHQSPDPTINPIPNGEWAHFAVVSDGSPGTAKMYTNGVLANTRAHTLPADNAFLFNIGGGGVFDGTGNFFNGQIDEVAVFNRALSDAQIAAQYRSAFVPLGYTFDGCTTPAGTALFGSGAPNGTIADDGSGVNCVLHLTDANQASAFGAFLINDLAAGNNVDHINIKWRSRIGGGQNGGADGYSLNWANDLPATPSYGNPGEEGAGTGLSFNVDTWDNGGGDLPGIQIKYKGAQVAFQQLPKDAPGNPTYLRKDVFVNAEADVDVSGVARFTYDGVTITANLPGWTGIAGGSYLFGARTGGANDNQWIDDIFVTAFAPGLPFITRQPTDQTVRHGYEATFSATADGTPPLGFQWLIKKAGDASFSPIAGANSPSYTTPRTIYPDDNNSEFKLQISNGLGSTESVVARLTVLPPVPLRVVRAESICNLRQVSIVYDQLVDPTSAIDVFNYAVDGGLGVSSVALNPDNLSVTLTLDGAQTPGATYCVTIGGVSSRPLQALDPNPTTVCFPACAISCGFARQEIYMGIGGVNITDLTGNPAYPNSPNITRYVGALSANNADEFDNYGTRISGWIIPPISGPYNFFLASDDGGDFYMSTDADPANLRLVATEPVWNPRRAYLAADRRNADPALRENRSTTLFPAGIELVAGQQYYFEARMKEGGGGDNLDVAWQIPGGPVPTDGSAPISGAFLASLANPVGAVITITQQPADISVPGCDGPACFSVAVTAVNSSGNNPPIFYQWERSDDGGTTYRSVLGANSAQICLTPTQRDNGAKFRVRVYIPGATVTSDSATLTVTADTVPPQIVSAARGASPHNAVNVTFSEALDPASANNAANYSIDNGVVVTGAALGSDGRTVVLSTATDLADGTCYTLAVGAVLDRCDNPVNAQAKIILQGAHAPAPGDPNNMIVIEAEDADGRSPARGRDWVFGNAAGGGGFSGTGYVADLPNGGATVGDTDLAAERVDYLVNLPVAGTWYVWARARSPGGQGNSCHIGIDGARPSTGYRFGNSGGWNGDTWQWDFALNDNAANLAQFTVATAGIHTFNIWSREDGLQIDKILLIPVAGIPPGTGLSRLATILGPAATPREISIPPPTVSITSPGDGSTLPACEPATICADASGCGQLSRIVSVEFFANGQPIGAATSAPWCITVPAAAVVPGNYTLTARVTDNFGLTGNSAPVLVRVVDAPPVITCPGDITARGSGNDCCIPVPNPIASDNCRLASVVCVPAVGTCLPVGQHTVTCTATDGAGLTNTCTFRVTVQRCDEPPMAVINSEQLIDLKPEFDNPVLLSCNWWNACLVADGYSSSTTPPGGALTYLWFADQDPVPFGAGPVVTNCLEVGTHTIMLVVTDPTGLTGTDSKIIEVVTAPLAIDLLIEQIETANKSGIVLTRKITRELTATLRVALSHAGREELRATQQALDAFEKKVRAQVVPIAPDAAAAWIRWSQAVSAGMEKCIKPPRKPKHDDDPKDPDPKDPPRK